MDVGERLEEMGIDEIVEMDGMYVLNVSWLYWGGRPGSHEQKYQQLSEYLDSPESPLPPGADWDLV